MKREIKFRAWDNYNNKFFEPIYEAYNNKLEELNIGMSGDLSIRDMTNSPKHESLFPSRFILMQFTGLHDKNGKEIYEGDILKLGDTVSFVVWALDGWQFNSYMERGSLDLYRYVDTTTGKEIAEVIGNIYENKDLLYV